MVDAENFYVLEDWTIDKARGKVVTGWVASWHGYQRQVINALEQLVKYNPQKPNPPFITWVNFGSFGSSYDPGRRVVGKIRAGVVSDCKKEFETGIFATLETSIKLAKGTVDSPASDVRVDHVCPLSPPTSLPHLNLSTILSFLWVLLILGCACAIVYQ
jgi:hypothetical protein